MDQQATSGNSGISLEEAITAVEETLEKYRDKTKTNTIQEFNEDIGAWFNTDSDSLSILSSQERLEVAHLMLRYYTYLMKEMSHQKTQLKTIENVIAKWAAPYWSKYSGYMPDEVRYALIYKNDNIALDKAIKLRNWIQLRIISIEDIAKVAKDHYHFFINYAKV